MAPEFFGFIAAIGCVAACIALAICAALPRRLGVRKLAMLGLLPAIGITSLFVFHLRQQFFLNEPMAIAAHQGSIDEVRRLLDGGASPDSWGVDGVETALTGAAEAGHTAIVQLLIDHGADPNLANGQGRTALAHARAQGHRAIEQALLKAGARERPRPKLGSGF